MRGLVLVIGIFSFFGSFAQEFLPDTTVNSICLENSKSIRKKFKTDTSQIESHFKESKAIFREVYFLSNDKSQILSLIFHPGDTKFSFSEFKIQYLKDFSKKGEFIQTKDLDFSTEKVIRLGILKEALLKKLGEPTGVKYENGFEVLEYKINDPNFRLLKRYKLPEYFAVYKFKQMHLVEFHFGFTYP